MKHRFLTDGNDSIIFVAATAIVALFLLILAALRSAPAVHVNPHQLAFEGTTDKSLDWVKLCLGQNWSGRLPLARRRALEPGTIRFRNAARHYTVDVIDDGEIRRMRAYTKTGKSFTEREIEALDGCLTGRAFSLGDASIK